jgi:maltose-binding protein MalE
MVRRPRPAVALLVLASLAALPGCALLRPLRHQTLQIYVVPSANEGGGDTPDAHVELAAPVLEAYRRLHPDVSFRMQLVPEEGLERELRIHRQRGLGPDLLLVRAPVAVSLMRKGLIAPLGPALRSPDVLSSIEPAELNRVREGDQLVGLPVAQEVSLACFDRRKVKSSPSTVGGLLSLAASGQNVGVSVDPIGIWWTAGSFGAAEAMGLLITDQPLPANRDLEKDQRAVAGWLRWLRQAALQSRVDIAAGADDLLNGLVEGRLSWVPCYSLNLMRLQQRMGPRLGVAPLPDGPAGRASPFSSLRIWSFGTDSSPAQRRLAEDLARFTLGPKQQRELVLSTQSVMPVNRFVMIPVANSGRLAAMAAAQAQFRQLATLMGVSFSADRVQRLLPSIERLIYEVMLGVITPEEGARQLLALRRLP